MDAIDGVVLHGIEAVLIPDVVEVVVFATLLHDALGVGTAVDVQHEEALVAQRRVRLLQVGEQLRTLLEQEVRKVERAGDVDLVALGLTNIRLDELDALTLVRSQFAEIVLAAPPERLRVEIDAPGAVVGVRFHPTARDGSGAAEVLAQQMRRPAVAFLEDAACQAHVRLGILDRFLIQSVFVGAFGHAGKPAALRTLHAQVALRLG